MKTFTILGLKIALVYFGGGSLPMCVYLGFSHEQKEGKQWFLYQKIGGFPS
jgi:hypothetical protein